MRAVEAACVVIATVCAACGGSVSPTGDPHEDCGLLELAGNQSGPSAVATDGEELFWSNFGQADAGDATISWVDVDGGDIHVVTTGEEQVHELALSSSSVFWVSGDQWEGQVVNSMDRSGNSPTTLATSNLVFDLRVYGSNLYWNANEFEVDRIPISGGPVTPVVTFDEAPRGLAFDQTYVYFGTMGSDSMGSLVRAPLVGGPPAVLATGIHLASSVAVDESWVYVSGVSDAKTNGGVWRVAKDGGVPIAIATDEANADNLTVDQHQLYWTAGTSIRAADLATWSVTTIATVYAPGFPSLAVDDRHFYLALSGSGDDGQGYTGGSLWRICKPLR